MRTQAQREYDNRRYADPIIGARIRKTVRTCNKNLYTKRKSAGLCTKCGGPIDPSLACVNCAACRSKRRQAHVVKVQHPHLMPHLDRRESACAICERRPPENKGLVRDHCHKSGQVRGFLCSSCNSGLGFFRDDAETLSNAVAYLRRWETVRNGEIYRRRDKFQTSERQELDEMFERAIA